ncbi:hypothetical protein GW17_00020888 [Ensete ventricosum]|nr:hypothetical protein GW17_00020888 [Ensete ventricosum]
MRLRTRLEYIGSLARVSGACQDSAREFFGRRPRLAERLLVVAEKLAGSCEGIGKIARNTLGDCRRKTMRLTIGNAGGRQITEVRSLIMLSGHIWL